MAEGEADKFGGLMLTNSEKILLLLSDFYRYEKDYRVPAEISQNGIARIIGIRRGNVARELIKLKRRGFVDEKLVHFEGVKRRKKGYFLTDKGLNLALKVRNDVSNRRIILRDYDGNRNEINIVDIKKYLKDDLLLAEIVAYISEDGIFDVKALEAEKKEVPRVEEVYTSKFIGRKDELRHLQKIYDDALKGSGKCLLISGEAGIGKTRLVHESIRRLTRKNIYFLQGRCLYQTTVDPYLPFVEAIRDYFRRAKKSSTDSTIKEIVSRAPEFGGLLPVAHGEKELEVVSADGDINLDSERTRIFETISKAFMGISEEKPIMLFIDDLHWADVGSIQFLHYLARNISKNPIIIIGVYRPEELVDFEGKPHPLKGTILRMRGEDIVKEIDLSRLGQSDSKKMTKAYLGKEAVSDEFTSLIHKETDGNPFFIEAILSNIKEEYIERLPTRIEIPKSIKDTILRRLERLSDEERDILEISSAIGERFDGDVLLGMSGMDEDKVLDSIDRLCDARLIEDDLSIDAEGYRFHHCKIQEVVYNELNGPRRRMLHERIGRTLEELYKDDVNEIVSDLAYHYSETKNYDKMYEYSWKAGEKASNVYSFDEAVSNYKTALSALDGIERNQSLEGEVESGEGLEKGDEDKDEMVFVSLLKGFDVESNEKKVSVLDRLGGAYDILGKWEESFDVYEKALNLTAEKNKKGEIAARIGSIYRKRGMFDKGVRICEEALKIVDKECKEKCLLLNCIGNILSRKGDFEKALEHLKQSLKIAKKIKNEKILAWIYYDMGRIYSEKCDNKNAVDFFDKSLKIFEKIGDRIGVASVYHELGLFHMRIDKYEDSLGFLEESLEIIKKIGGQHGIASIHHDTSLVYYNMGDYDKALEFCEKTLKIYEKVGDLLGIARVWTDFGLNYLKKGDYKEAESYFRKSSEIVSTARYKGAVYNLLGLAECSLRKDNDVGMAMKFCHQALRFSREFGFRSAEGESLKIFGMIYSEIKDWESSIKSFEDSVKIFKEIEYPVNLGETYYEYAQMWKKKGEIKKAKEDLKLAFRIFDERNLDKKVERIKKELIEIEK